MRKTMDNLIKKFNISYFKKIVTNEDVKKDRDKKPASFMINKILTDLSIYPQETICVGDAKSDVIMARNAKVTPIVVLTGHLTQKEAKELKVNFIIKDMTKLETVLTKLS